MPQITNSHATVSVAVNGVEDFFVIEIPADADEAAIVEAIEAESSKIGGSDAEPVFDGFNSVSVYRNGIEIADLRQEEAPRRRA